MFLLGKILNPRGIALVNATYNTGEFPTCVWFMDSLTLDPEQYTNLEKSLQMTDCSWRIIVSHYPIITAGVYWGDPEIIKFRRRISPLIKKYKIDFYISGHDHSSQVIHHNRNFNDTVFLIAGAPSFVNIHSVSRARPLPGGADLVWFDDRNLRVVLYLELTPEQFEYKFVKLTDKGDEIIMSGTKSRK